MSLPQKLRYVGKKETLVQKVVSAPKEIVKPKEEFWVDSYTAENLLKAYGDIFKAIDIPVELCKAKAESIKHNEEVRQGLFPKEKKEVEKPKKK